MGFMFGSLKATAAAAASFYFRFGSGGSSLIRAVPDASGNIYVAGRNDDVGAEVHQIMKLDANGGKTWARKLGLANSSGYTSNPYSAGLDSSNNFYTIGVGAKDSSSTGYICVVAKYDSSGAIQWQKKITPTTGSAGAVIGDVDSSGNCYVLFNDGTDNVIMKIDNTGAVSWARKVTGFYSIYGVAVDTSGNAVLMGSLYDTSYRCLLAKWNTSGALQWSRKLAGNYSEWYGGGAFDSSGNIYLNGYDYTTDYYSLSAKYNSSGSIQWQKKASIVSGKGYYGYSGIAVDPSGNSYFGIIPNSGGDPGIVSLDSSGAKRWAKLISKNFLAGFAIDASFLYASTATTSNGGRLLKMPVAGPANGTYTDPLMTSIAVADESSQTFSSSSFTDSAGGVTDAAYTAYAIATWGGTDSADTTTTSVLTPAF